MDLEGSAAKEIKGEVDPPEDKSENGDESQRSEGETLYEEVGDLAKYISNISQQINSAESLVEDVYVGLPQGSDQLSEVTRKTEEATRQILDDTEKMIGNHELMSAKLESLKATLFDESLNNTTRVKEDIAALNALIKNNKDIMFNLVGTLSFQDPAGQEIKKVDEMLQGLQSRLLKLVITFGKDKKKFGDGNNLEEKMLSAIEDTTKKEKRITQDLVDTVLKSYGF